MYTAIKIGGALATASLMIAGGAAMDPASAHYGITGESLTWHQVHKVERIVHHLPFCDWPEQVTGCKNRIGHRKVNASFHADGVIYYVVMARGQLTHVEVYQ